MCTKHHLHDQHTVVNQTNLCLQHSHMSHFISGGKNIYLSIVQFWGMRTFLYFHYIIFYICIKIAVLLIFWGYDHLQKQQSSLSPLLPFNSELLAVSPKR